MTKEQYKLQAWNHKEKYRIVITSTSMKPSTVLSYALLWIKYPCNSLHFELNPSYKLQYDELSCDNDDDLYCMELAIEMGYNINEFYKMCQIAKKMTSLYNFDEAILKTKDGIVDKVGIKIGGYKVG